MKQQRWIWLGVGLVFGLIGLILFWYLVRWLTLGDAPRWNNLEVGQTSVGDVISILGMPTEITTVKVGDVEKYKIYIYKEHPEFQWQRVEIWIDILNATESLVGIIQKYPYDYGTNGTQTLDQYVIRYGQPDKVTWSVYCGLRTLIWARHGVQILAVGDAPNSDWADIPVSSVMFFEPVLIEQFMTAPWPRISIFGYADANMCVAPYIDSPDSFPEDPYDWANMPRP